MIHLILGGSASGKSSYAEQCVLDMEQAGVWYYIATMQIRDEESRKRVERHRQLRRDKNFITIECPRDIGKLAEQMEQEACALVECISNLAANEMFVEDKKLDGSAVYQKVMEELKVLATSVKNLVIVSNNIFEDGIQYDDVTKEYQRTLGQINGSLAAMSDHVTEVVLGIPVEVK